MPKKHENFSQSSHGSKSITFHTYLTFPWIQWFDGYYDISRILFINSYGYFRLGLNESKTIPSRENMTVYKTRNEIPEIFQVRFLAKNVN